ncbi:hypothetical protein [Ornithinibacillus halotolerans]|uniref:Uncharacterized protein n=1 Tax=Ornithinibacillus halotolerans TaxID=1274357 RepID=A0A916SEM2_9BACI|nr:hypothetical protein [Ornithinibacillus halotolerans]GGA92781.1 hypothetical protein GCM10008025_39010 [Ornithinibacillus halotolerans]
MAAPLRKVDEYSTNYSTNNRKGKFIFIIILVLLIGYSLINGLEINQHKKVREYLETRQQYFSASDSDFKELLSKVHQSKDISSLNSDIIQVKASLENHFQAFNDLKYPKNFEQLHKDTGEWFIKIVVVLDYLEIVSLKNSFQAEVFNQYIADVNNVLSKLKPSFVQGLQKSNIRYIVEPEGHITYWIKEDQYRQ